MQKIRRTVKSELNRLIDDMMHLHFKEYPIAIIMDGLLHAMVEQNPDMSLRKFVRYNVPELLRYLARKQE